MTIVIVKWNWKVKYLQKIETSNLLTMNNNNLSKMTSDVVV